jgi:carbonic anhydrase
VEEDMTRRFHLLAALALAPSFLLGAAAIAQDDYGYACVNCPANWLALDIEDNNCGGPYQSPIAFSDGDVKGKDKPKLEADYGNDEQVSPEFTLTNIEWGDEDPGSNTVELDGETYEFQQFHFHTTAEHVVNGERSDLEMHFVNNTSGGATLVLAVFITEGEENDAFSPITDSLPGPEEVVVDLQGLLPKKRDSYRYSGSTTTPPCSGGVQWNLFKKPVELSWEQIESIQEEIWDINAGFDNNRTIQNREGRKIRKGK